MAETNSTEQASVNPVDEIANLLIEDEDEELEQSDSGSDDTESESEGSEEDKAGGSDDVTWASALGVDDSNLELDEEGDLVGIRVKVNGEESVVGVKDLIAGYQTNKYITQKSQVLSHEKKEFDTVRERAASMYVEKLQVADKLVETLKTSLVSDYNRVDWDRLRADNPAEWSALQTEYQNRLQQIEQVTAAIEQERSENMNLHNQMGYQRFQEYVMDQYNRVLAENPEWRNNERMQKDMQELGRGAIELYGITPDEFNALVDARHVRILKDALAYRQGKKALETKHEAPKFQKGGRTGKQMDKLTKLTLRAKKASGAQQRAYQTDAVAELLMNLK